MDHARGVPNRPQTQGKIECWHQTLKNRILLRRAQGIHTVEMEAAALMAFGKAKAVPVVCIAHITRALTTSPTARIAARSPPCCSSLSSQGGWAGHRRADRSHAIGCDALATSDGFGSGASRDVFS